MLSKVEQERIAELLQKDVAEGMETIAGSCVAVDEKTGKEYSHKWRDGEARVFVEDEETGESHEYVYAVRVELVAVEKV